MCKGTPAAPPPLNKGSYLGSKGAGSRSTPRTTQGGKGSGRGSGPVKTQNSSCTPAMKPEKYKSPSDLMWLRNYLSSRGAPNADIEANCHSLLELRHLGVTLGLLQPTADEEGVFTKLSAFISLNVTCMPQCLLSATCALQHLLSAACVLQCLRSKCLWNNLAGPSPPRSSPLLPRFGVSP